ncbi:MAG: hypothetical protein Q9163_001365 [Psora crenata]
MIKAIFFATFDVSEGPKIHHQLPPDSVHPSASSASIPLFAFQPLTQYIIPAPALSNRPLQFLTPERPHHRILSHPVTIDGEHYPRNAFTFNFCLVLEEDTGFHSYLPVVKKLATLFRDLEEQERFLSTELAKHGPNEGRIHAICEILLEDLNNYSECMIPISDTTSTLNIKLFPIYPPPPPLHAHQVPLLTVKVDQMVDSSWDLTMCRILPFINGIHSVKRIALLADTDLKLTRKAIKHLLHYGCAILLDIFSFSAVYAPTPAMAEFVQNEAMQQEECLRYVALPCLQRPTPASNSNGNGNNGVDMDMYMHAHNRHLHNDDLVVEESSPMSTTRLIELYLSLHQGQSVKAWCAEHPSVPKALDVRRFITFGVIKGFLYRVHRYAIAASVVSSTARKGKSLQQQRSRRVQGEEKLKGDADDDVEGEENEDEEGLGKYLDGTHCFDEICTDLMISEKDLMGRLKAWGDVQIICR